MSLPEYLRDARAFKSLLLLEYAFDLGGDVDDESSTSPDVLVSEPNELDAFELRFEDVGREREFEADETV